MRTLKPGLLLVQLRFELLRCRASPEGGSLAEHWNTEPVFSETSFGLDFTQSCR